MKPYQKLALASIVKSSVPKPLIELSDKQIEKLKTFGGVMLSLLAVGGLLTMTVLAPNAIQALKIFEKRRGRSRVPHKEKIRKVTRTFYYLKRRGEVEFRRKGNDYQVVLTDRGKEKLCKLNFETLQIQKDTPWDKKFWLVAADIPVKFKLGADAMRQKIKELGLYPLQRTLWFYPVDPRAEVEFVARTYGVSQFVTAMKVGHLDPEDEEALKKHFQDLGVI